MSHSGRAAQRLRPRLRSALTKILSESRSTSHVRDRTAAFCRTSPYTLDSVRDTDECARDIPKEVCAVIAGEIAPTPTYFFGQAANHKLPINADLKVHI